MTYVIFLSLVLLVEAIVWAIAFLAMGVASGFWQAVYFSIVTLTTLGYGDLVPPENAQMVAAFCAMAGLFLVGLSTAFVVEILRRIDT
ncbi:MAG: ion channel [Pseudomonadota bacterium]